MSDPLEQRISLCATPSPVSSLEALRPGLWLKDDGELSPLYGGNKVRKLEFLLHQAPPELTTIGASGSNHVLATVLHAQALGHRVHALAIPRIWAPLPAMSLRITLKNAATLRLVPNLPLAKSALMAAPQGSVIPAGGSNRFGSLGFVRAGLELAEQVRAGLLPEPQRIAIALGTGGSALGLALGCRMGGLSSQVHGVRVVPHSWLSVRRLKRLADEIAGLLGEAPAPIEVIDGRLGPGYGWPGPSTLRTLQRAQGHLNIEGTYTAKTLAEALDWTGGPDLYWSTLNARPLLGLLAGAPQVPRSPWFT